MVAERQGSVVAMTPRTINSLGRNQGEFVLPRLQPAPEPAPIGHRVSGSGLVNILGSPKPQLFRPLLAFRIDCRDLQTHPSLLMGDG